MFIVDSNLKDAVQPAGIAALKERHPGSRVVVLADTFNLEQMMTALKGGADGYCLPTVEALIRYLDLVMLGETAFPVRTVPVGHHERSAAGRDTRFPDRPMSTRVARSRRHPTPACFPIARRKYCIA